MNEDIPMTRLDNIPVTRLDNTNITILDDIQSSMDPNALVNKMIILDSEEKWN